MGTAPSIGRLGRKAQVVPGGLPPAHTRELGHGGDMGTRVIGKVYPTYVYTNMIASFPSVAALLSILVPVSLCFGAMVAEDLSYDTSLQGFEISDHSTVKARDVTQLAAEDWRLVRDRYVFQSAGSRLSWSEEVARTDHSGMMPRSIPWKRIWLQYKAKIPGGPDAAATDMCSEGASTELFEDYDLMSNEDVLRFMLQIEKRVVKLPEYRSLCFTSNRKATEVTRTWPGCVPLVSFVQYFFPGEVRWSEYGLDFKFKYFWDFEPQETPDLVMQRPVSSVHTTFFQNPHWRWFTDQRNDAHTRQSALLRTQITLGQPLGGGLSMQEADKKLKRFVSMLTKVLDPFVEETWEGQPSADGPQLMDGSRAPPHVQLTYGGDAVVETKIDEAISRDWVWVAVACGVVAIAFKVYTNSTFIAVAAMAQTMTTFYASVFIYLRSHETLSLYSLLSFYILLAMSCDGVAVFFNTFRQTAFMGTSGRQNTLNVPQRLAFCFRKAGAGVATAHIAAAVSFSCVSVSPVPAVSRFGVFMVVLMLANLYMFLTFFPCILIFHHFHVSKRRRNFQRQKEVTLRRAAGRHSAALVSALRDFDNSRRDGPHFRCNGQGDGAGRWRSVETSEIAAQVQSGGARVGFDLQLRRRKKAAARPPTEPRQLEELADEFDRLATAGMDQSRRRQPKQKVLRLPQQLTCLRTEWDERSSEQALRVLLSVANSREGGGAEGADFNSSHDFWAQVGHSVGVGSLYGPQVFADPRTSQVLDCARRVPQVALALRDWWSGPSRIAAVHQQQQQQQQQQQRPSVSCNSAAPLASPDVAVSTPEAVELLPQEQPQQVPGEQVTTPSPPTPLPPPPPQRPPGSSIWQSLEQWWERKGSHKRRFGRFGKRVGETREEKDSRIMGKRAKREGYTAVERLFYNRFAPVIRRLHVCIVVVYGIVFVVMAATHASFLRVSSQRPRLLDDSGYEEFEKVRRQFPVEGPCDFCSAYYRPFSDFPPPFGRGSGDGIAGENVVPPAPAEQEEQLRRLKACGYQMYQILDSCGICGGNDECLDCMGQAMRCPGFDQSTCLADGKCLWDPSEKVCKDAPQQCPREGGSWVAGWKRDSCGACIHPDQKDNEERVWVARDGSTCELAFSPRPEQCHSCEGLWPPVGNCQPCFVQKLKQNRAADPAVRVSEGELAKWKTFYPPPLEGHRSCDVECRGFETSKGGNCDPLYGRCSPFTGECLCLTDYKHGFFASDPLTPWVYCSVCLEGFYPTPGELRDNPKKWPENTRPCTLECTLPDGPDDPNCYCRCALQPGQVGESTACDGSSGTRCSRCTTANGDRLRGSLAEAPPAFATSHHSAAVGYACRTQWTSQCEHGTMDPRTGICRCNSAYDDRAHGGTCQTAAKCSFHGVLDERTGEDCMCFSCWTGPTCAEHTCQNGGRCQDLSVQADPWQWRCECAGVWEGQRCTDCPSSCMKNGNCPLPWPDTFYGNPELRQNDRYLQCWGCKGNWDGPLCNVCNPPASVPPLQRSRASCDEHGLVVGCDGMAATDEPGTYKWLADCGGVAVCLGQSPGGQHAGCVGCDGVPGSNRTVDKCGVCGGFNECSCDGESFAREKARLEIVWGLVPLNTAAVERATYNAANDDTLPPDAYSANPAIPTDSSFKFADTGTQLHLLWVCQQLYYRPDQVEPQQSECLMEDWRNFLHDHVMVMKRVEGRLRRYEVRECSVFNCAAADDETLVTLSFPWAQREEGEVDWLLYQFMEKKQKYDFLGFSTAVPDNSTMRLRWLRMRFTLRVDADTDPEAAKRLYDYWQRIVGEINNPRWKEPGDLSTVGVCFQWSQLWVNTFTQLQAKKGVTYSIGLSAGAFLVIVLLYSCSIVLTLLSCTTVAGIVVSVVSTMKALEWELGPTEQIGLACLMGLSAEYTVHLAGGYLEYLHASQSTMLARDTTREQAIAGTLQRTGVPVCVSALTMTTASLVLLLCEINVFRRVAQMMLMNVLYSAVHGLVVFSALLMAAAPTAVRRSHHRRLVLLGLSAGCACFTLVTLYLAGEATDPTGEPLFD